MPGPAPQPGPTSQPSGRGGGGGGGGGGDRGVAGRSMRSLWPPYPVAAALSALGVRRGVAHAGSGVAEGGGIPLPRRGPVRGPVSVSRPAGPGRGAAAEAAGGRFPILPIWAREPWRR